jgi:hypothetical protein
MLQDSKRNLEQKARTAFLRREHQPAADPPAESVTLRVSRGRDGDDLDRLAQLEGRPTPTGPHVVAELGGTIVAALPLEPGPALADPFRPTAHLIPLLELRVKQIAHDRPRRRTRAAWRLSWVVAAHRAAYGPSAQTSLPVSSSSSAALPLDQHDCHGTPIRGELGPRADVLARARAYERRHRRCPRCDRIAMATRCPARSPDC